MAHHRGLQLLVAVMGLLVAGLATPPVAAAAEPVDRLPDLRMASLTDFHLQTTSAGKRLLRFDTVIVNVGDGPFFVQGRRACTSFSTCPAMTVKQRITRSDGTNRYVTRPTEMRYAGDGHDHWHVQEIESYEIFKLGNETLRRGAKVGYCFFDNVRYRLSLPRAPQSRVYGEAGCGTRSSTTAKMGLSVGWGDLYPWDFAYQWIDVTGLPAGDYRVCVTADPYDQFYETVDGNNHVWQDVTITRSGVTVRGKGWSRCRPDATTAAAGDAASTTATASEADASWVPELPPARAVFGTVAGSATCRIAARGTRPTVGAQACGRAASGGSEWLAPLPARTVDRATTPHAALVGVCRIL